MQNLATTVLTRKDFTLTAPQVADTGYLQLNIRYDDGFVAYLNGTKIAERSAPVSLSGTSAASAVRDFYLTNPIARASAVIAELSALKKNIKQGTTGTHG